MCIRDSAKAMLVFNPPYNKRIQVMDAESFYDKIGTHLKHNFQNCEALVLSSNLFAIKRIGLKPKKRYTLYNGPDETKLVHFEMYQGTKKPQNA